MKNRLLQFLSWVVSRPLWAAVVVCVVCALIVELFYRRGLPNDDYQIAYLLANGGGEHLVGLNFFTSYPLAAVLNFLTLYLADWDWYSLTLVGSYYASVVGLFYVVFSFWWSNGIFEVGEKANHAEQRVALCFAGVAFLAMFLCVVTMVSGLQFSVASSFAVLVGFLLFYKCLRLGWNWTEAVVGMILVLLGYMIRDFSLAYLLLWGGVFGGFACLGWWGRYRELWGSLPVTKMLISGGVTVVLVGGAYFATSWQYEENEEWGVARNLQMVRAGIQDVPVEDATPVIDELEKSGLSKNEAVAFASFVYVESPPVTLDTLTVPQQEARNQHYYPMRTDAKSMHSLFLTGSYGPILLLATLYCFVVLRSGKNRIDMLACLGTLVVLLLMLWLRDRFPGRITYAPYVVTLSMLLMLARPQEARKWLSGRVACCAMLIAAMGVILFQFRAMRWEVQRTIQQWSSPAPKLADKFNAIMDANPKAFYFFACDPISTKGPYQFNHSHFANNRLLMISPAWYYYSPAYQDNLRRLGFGSPYVELVQNEKVFLVTKEEGGLQTVLNLCEERVGNPVKAECLHQIYYPDGEVTYKIWKIARSTTICPIPQPT